MSKVSEALNVLQAWADATEGAIVRSTPAASDEQARLEAPSPHSGSTPEWALPPSYLELLRSSSELVIKWGPNLGHDEFVVLDPAGITSWSGVVYLPGDIMEVEDESTNHLVPFASAGNDECAFCFDVSDAPDGGEYPVYYTHQDHPRGRSTESGEWNDSDDETPDFESFAHWLSWVAAELTAGNELPCSYPSAFYEMPGRNE